MDNILNRTEIKNKLYMLSDRLQFLSSSHPMHECPILGKFFELMTAITILTKLIMEEPDNRHYKRIFEEIEIALDAYQDLHCNNDKALEL